MPQVYGDRQQLNQVFLNIILNALDAMPNGGTLNISVHNTKDREYVAVDFTDTGVGIPEHKLSDVFDPFYTSKRNGKGTGLGLSVSLGIVQKHGGEIKVSSKVNQGTTFTVLLPAAKIPASIPEFSS
jgi:two-component system NtrC family sensor kinase